MKITKFGKVSLILLLSSITFIFLGSNFSNLIYKNVLAGNSMWEDLTLRPLLVLFILFGFFLCVISFILGLYSIFKKKERSIFVFISVVFESLIIFLLFVEMFLDH